MTMLYIKYASFVSCCGREDFFHIFPLIFSYIFYKSMVDNDMPGAWPVWTPGVPLAALIKESIIHWSTQHMKALGHMVSEKKIFFAGFIAEFKEVHYSLLHTKYESFGFCGFGEVDFLMFFP